MFSTHSSYFFCQCNQCMIVVVTSYYWRITVLFRSICSLQVEEQYIVSTRSVFSLIEVKHSAYIHYTIRRFFVNISLKPLPSIFPRLLSVCNKWNCLEKTPLTKTLVQYQHIFTVSSVLCTTSLSERWRHLVTMTVSSPKCWRLLFLKKSSCITSSHVTSQHYCKLIHKGSYFLLNAEYNLNMPAGDLYSLQPVHNQLSVHGLYVQSHVSHFTQFSVLNYSVVFVNVMAEDVFVV